MDGDDFQRFRAVMAMLCEVFKTELSGRLLDAYWVVLGSWTLAEFQAVAGHLMGTQTFMPRPSEFQRLRKAGRPTAGEAWAQVLAYVRTGSYDHTRPHVNAQREPSPLAQRAAAALGGYVAIGKYPEDSLQWLERRFCEHYEAMRDATDVREALPQITRDGFEPAGQLAHLPTTVATKEPR